MDLETLVTSREGFGLESATFLQRAICRMIDGAPLDDLLGRGTESERAQVHAALGCEPSALSGVAPTEVQLEAPVRTFKTVLGAAVAIRAAAHAIDPSQVLAGQEPPRYSALSIAVDTARAFRGHLEIVKAKPALQHFYIGDTADGVTVRHPSGLPIEIKVVAAQRGGYSIHSRWSAGVCFSEAPGWYSTDKIVSLEESRDTALGRLLPGAQILYEGSPWQPSGFCYEQRERYFGRPDTDYLVISPQAVGDLTPAEQLNPSYWTPKRVAKIKRTSPRTYRMHVLNQYGSSANAAFDFDDVRAAMRPVESIPSFYRAGNAMLALDPSSLAGDAWAWSAFCWLYPPADPVPVWLTSTDATGRVVEHPNSPARDKNGNIIFRDDFDQRPVLRVFASGAWAGDDLRRVTVDEIVSALGEFCRANGITSVVSDQRESAALESMFQRQRLWFRSFPWTNESKDAAVTTLRRLLKERRLWIAPDDRMQQEMLAYSFRLGAGGKLFYSGRFGHDDRVATLITFAHALNAGHGEYPNVRYDASGR